MLNRFLLHFNRMDEIAGQAISDEELLEYIMVEKPAEAEHMVEALADLEKLMKATTSSADVNSKDTQIEQSDVGYDLSTTNPQRVA